MPFFVSILPILLAPNFQDLDPLAYIIFTAADKHTIICFLFTVAIDSALIPICSCDSTIAWSFTMRITKISDRANSEGIQGREDQIWDDTTKWLQVTNQTAALTKCYLLHLYRNRFPDLTRQQLTLIQRLQSFCLDPDKSAIFVYHSIKTCSSKWVHLNARSTLGAQESF